MKRMLRNVHKISSLTHVEGWHEHQCEVKCSVLPKYTHTHTLYHVSIMWIGSDPLAQQISLQPKHPPREHCTQRLPKICNWFLTFIPSCPHSCITNPPHRSEVFCTCIHTSRLLSLRWILYLWFVWAGESVGRNALLDMKRLSVFLETFQSWPFY